MIQVSSISLDGFSNSSLNSSISSTRSDKNLINAEKVSKIISTKSEMVPVSNKRTRFLCCMYSKLAKKTASDLFTKLE